MKILSDDVLEKVITRGVEVKTKGAESRLTHGMHHLPYAVPPSEEFLKTIVAAPLSRSPKHDGKSPNIEFIPISTNKLLFINHSGTYP